VQHGEQIRGGAVLIDQDGGELVAPEPPGDAGGADVVGEPFRHGLQQGVACGVAVGVVDLLEAVDVGNARVRGFRDWCDDEPGHLPTVGGGSGSGSTGH
jgi:hypothetical protein